MSLLSCLDKPLTSLFPSLGFFISVLPPSPHSLQAVRVNSRFLVPKVVLRLTGCFLCWLHTGLYRDQASPLSFSPHPPIPPNTNSTHCHDHRHLDIGLLAPIPLTFFFRSRERFLRLRLDSSFSFCSCRAWASISLIFFSCLAAWAMAGQTAVPSRAHTCTLCAAPSKFPAKEVCSPHSNAVDPDECESSNERKIESSQ